MTDMIIIDDTLPVRRGWHFLIKRDHSQIVTSVLGARYLADVMCHSWWAIGFIMQAIEAAHQVGESWSKVEALAHIANRILRADLWKQEFERNGGVLELVSPARRELDE